MSIETVRLFLRETGFEDRIQEFGVSSATVNLACLLYTSPSPRDCS